MIVQRLEVAKLTVCQLILSFYDSNLRSNFLYNKFQNGTKEMRDEEEEEKKIQISSHCFIEIKIVSESCSRFKRTDNGSNGKQ